MFENRGLTKQVQAGRTRLLDASFQSVVTDAEIRSQLRLAAGVDTDYLDMLGKSCTDYCRQYIGRALLTTNVMRIWDQATVMRQLRAERMREQVLYLPYGPVISLTRLYSVTPDGDETDVSNYTLDNDSDPARLYLRESVIGRQIATLIAEYSAGYGATVDDVPPAIRHGVLMHVAYLYEHRGDCDAVTAAEKSGAKDLYAQYKAELI